MSNLNPTETVEEMGRIDRIINAISAHVVTLLTLILLVVSALLLLVAGSGDTLVLSTNQPLDSVGRVLVGIFAGFILIVTVRKTLDVISSSSKEKALEETLYKLAIENAKLKMSSDLRDSIKRFHKLHKNGTLPDFYDWLNTDGHLDNKHFNEVANDLLDLE